MPVCQVILNFQTSLFTNTIMCITIKEFEFLFSDMMAGPSSQGTSDGTATETDQGKQRKAYYFLFLKMGPCRECSLFVWLNNIHSFF